MVKELEWPGRESAYRQQEERWQRRNGAIVRYKVGRRVAYRVRATYHGLGVTKVLGEYSSMASARNAVQLDGKGFHVTPSWPEPCRALSPVGSWFIEMV